MSAGARAVSLLGLWAILVACGDDAGSGDGGTPDGGGDALAADAASPDSGVPGALLGSFQLTYYWVTQESEFTGADDTNIYDQSCNLIDIVPSAFFASARLEGTGRLTDGRIINYTGSCSCMTSPCFVVVDDQHPWGIGAGNRALVPFRSIAVDRTVITLGSKIYVAEFDGVRMPGVAPYGDFVHDGCVSADDVGGGIQGTQIDFFAALKDYYRVLDGQLKLSRVTVYQGGTRCR